MILFIRSSYAPVYDDRIPSHTTVVYGNIRCPYTSAYDNRICTERNGSICVTCANIKELVQYKQAFIYETNDTEISPLATLPDGGDDAFATRYVGARGVEI